MTTNVWLTQVSLFTKASLSTTSTTTHSSCSQTSTHICTHQHTCMHELTEGHLHLSSGGQCQLFSHTLYIHIYTYSQLSWLIMFFMVKNLSWQECCLLSVKPCYSAFIVVIVIYSAQLCVWAWKLKLNYFNESFLIKAKQDVC